MTATVRNPSRSRFATPTATYKVSFGKGNRNGAGNGKARPEDRIPRFTRLLALAHRIEGMIRAGELKDWAEAARLIGVTRARMTQTANLLLLAPEIQEYLLHLPSVTKGPDPITERELRPLVVAFAWSEQRTTWRASEMRSRPPSPAAPVRRSPNLIMGVPWRDRTRLR